VGNQDPDTDVFGAGMTGLERFVYTSTLDGVTSVQTLAFQVSGIDEPRQLHDVIG